MPLSNLKPRVFIKDQIRQFVPNYPLWKYATAILSTAPYLYCHRNENRTFKMTVLSCPNVSIGHPHRLKS